MSIRGSYIAIPVVHKGVTLFAVIDRQDEWAASHTWSYSRGYATRALPRNGKKTIVLVQMHREILGLKNGDSRQVDHINRNKLDNRRCNLRITDHFGNAQNRPAQSNNKSGVRGVWWIATLKKWRARVVHKGISHEAGLHTRLEDAASSVEAKRRSLGFLDTRSEA